DDRVPGPVGGCAEADALTDGILAGELASGERLADHRNLGRAGHVVLVEPASSAKRNAQRLEIARAHRAAERVVLVLGIAVMFEMNAVEVGEVRIAAQRQLAGEGRRGDA